MDIFRRIYRAINVVLGFFNFELLYKKNRYAEDGLYSLHNHDFLEDLNFKKTIDYVSKEINNFENKLRFRNYIAIKLAEYASHLSSNFCECGVGDGVISLSILKYFQLKKIAIPNLWLFDTFSGIEPSIIPQQEIKFWGISPIKKKEFYSKVYNSNANTIKARFSKLSKKVKIIQGFIPSTFTKKNINDIRKSGYLSFIHIDMNNSVPEVAALKTFFPLLINGGIILFDDYAYCGYNFQKQAIDVACIELGIPLPITLPTGQGLIIKSKNKNFSRRVF